MNDIKRRLCALEQKHAESSNQMDVVFVKAGDDTYYNRDGSVYEPTGRGHILLNWDVRGV
jgi:hypothetical protein